ncbi:hypothetical protein ACS0TU_06735, partial [Enterobacter hormaechei]
MGEISVKTGNNARNGGKNSLNRLIRCVCGKKIGPDPRNFNQRVSLGRHDLLIRTFLKYFTFTQNSECDRNWLVRYIPVGVSKDYVARDLNQNVYGDFPSVSEVKRNILHRLHYELWKSQAKLTIEVNNLETLLMEVAQRSADQNNYILMIYGSRFSEELRELVYQPARHDAFSIHVDVSARGSRSLPFRINNCLIYLVLNSEQKFSLMVSAESFGELRLFRYPDGTLFNTFYRSN